MKKMLLLIGMCFLAFGLCAQEEGSYLLSDQHVVPPQFEGESAKDVNVNQSPICCYIQNNIDYPEMARENYREGIVGIEFTIEPDGSLSNFVVSNAVDHYLDDLVISCIKKTEGMWKPGMVNNTPSPMEKRVYVKFDLEGNDSFNELAERYYFNAIKHFTKGENAQSNNLLTASKQKKKSTRQYNASLAQLDKATVLFPNDVAILYWQAKNYENLGMEEEMLEMMERRNELVAMKLLEEELVGHYDLATIRKK